MTDTIEKCLVCERTSHEIPLVELRYQAQSFWICPQHIPVLIHQPQTLIGKLPGAEHLEPHHH